MASASNILSSYRLLGYNSNHIPLCIRYHQKHKENYVVTCVGQAFHTYNCSRLGIVSTSNLHEEIINCMAVDGSKVFTGCGKIVQSFTRGRQVCNTYKGHNKNVRLILPFGNHLISVDEDSHLIVWDIQTEEVYLDLVFDKEAFLITCIVHPSTYLNKLLLGSKQGQMQLWNIKTNKQQYTFTGWEQQVTVLEQAPALDTMGIGLADGRIILHNIKYDETVMAFRQDWGPVTAISFRTDGHPVMVTGSHIGHIALWNLEEKRLFSQIRNAHSSGVTGLECLPNEPLLVTSSPDNSLKVWIFDQTDGGGRLLRQRCGHSAPPSHIRFYGNNGQTIISAGQDSTIQTFSTVHDSGHRSLGRASFHKESSKKSGLKLDQHMMPPVTHLSAESARESDWDNIVACHMGLCQVTTWTSKRSTMGSHRLKHERFEDTKQYRLTTAEAVDISSCGNFTVIGYSSGHVDQYNIQSGIFRGSYGSPKAHDCCVRGVCIDGLNQVTITSGADGSVKFWRINKKEHLQTIILAAAISQMIIHRESSLLAISRDDFVISIVDIDTQRCVREFSGQSNRITDMTFSPDARWLISSSMDSSVNTWDLPLGKLVDSFLVDSAVTSLTLSPTGEFLATCHVDSLGIYLWSNKTLYQHVSLRPLPDDYEPLLINMPSTCLEDQVITTELVTDGDAEEMITDDYKSPSQISDELVTLSLLPSSRWLNLLQLDVIKERNKPKLPPKIPKAAPFFLPTIPGLDMTFNPADDTVNNEMKTTLSVKIHMQNLSEFGRCLQAATNQSDYVKLLAKLKEMGPSSIDLEVRTLAPDAGGSVDLMAKFMGFLDSLLETRRDFELVSAYLGLFIKLHGEIITSQDKLVSIAEKVLEKQETNWSSLEDKFCQSICIVNYLRSAIL